MKGLHIKRANNFRKMRSLRNIILLAVIGSISMTTQAQQKTLLQSEMVAKQLGLNAKQKADLDKHFKNIKSEREASMAKIKALREEIQRDGFVKRQEQVAKLKSILTEEQFAKLQAHQKNVGNRRVQAQGRQQGKMRVQTFRGQRIQRGQQGQRMQRGQQKLGVQRGQQRQFGTQRQQRGQGSDGELRMNPEMRKKFQEFLELEKQKKEKSGGGN